MRGLSRLTIVALLVLAGFAPGASATSLFSMVFLGERLESGDARSIALGGSTQLVPDSLGVLQLNPALLGDITLVTIGATQFIAVDEGRSAEFSERDISVVFSAFRAAFPIAGRFVFSVGYRGRYDPDGTFELRDQTNSGDQFTRRFRKSGGLFSVPFTISANVTRYASVGLTFSLEQGFVEERWDIEFDDSTFTPGAGLKKEDVSGEGFGAGVVLRPFERLIIGGTYESSIDYDTDVRTKFTQSALDSSYGSSAMLPARASVGVSWGVTESLMLLASYAWSDFDDFEGFAFPAGRVGREEFYAFGIEYAKGIPLRGKRLPIRVSFNYEKLPFTHPAGQQVNKFLLGIGTGLAIRGGKGRIEFALQAGKVGALNDNGIEDRLVRIYLGLVGGERWQRKGGSGF